MIQVGNIPVLMMMESLKYILIWIQFHLTDSVMTLPTASGSDQLNLLQFVIFQMKQNIWLYAFKLSKYSI